LNIDEPLDLKAREGIDKMKIRALVVEEKDAPFEAQEIELEEPGRGEVLVHIVASGVCHTDAITRGSVPARPLSVRPLGSILRDGGNPEGSSRFEIRRGRETDPAHATVMRRG